MTRRPPPLYHIQVEFRAPLSFVYRWCTDYDPKDSQLGGEHYERRILRRSHRRVLYEDLWWRADGWRWRRNDVTLLPPDRWVADSIGNYRDAHIEYRLRELGPDRTRLNLRLRRRPGRRELRQPAQRTLEAELILLWRNYARALEREYRRSHGGSLRVERRPAGARRRAVK